MMAGGKRPRLKAEGDVYGAEEEDTSKGEGSEGFKQRASEEVVYTGRYRMKKRKSRRWQERLRQK